MEESYVHKPHGNIQETKIEQIQEFYTVLGNHDYLDEADNPRLSTDKHCMAKKISMDDGNLKYLVKINRENRIYNPLGMYSEGRHKKFLAKVGKDEFSFKRVNMEIFEYYLNFLRTRNDAWLKIAERSLI